MYLLIIFIILLGLYCLVGYLLSTKFINIRIDYITKKLAKIRGFRVVKNVDLKYHPFFLSMNYQINYGISSIKINNTLKNKLLIDFLLIKFRVFKDNYFEFVTIKGIDKLSKEELKANIFSLFTDSIMEYNNEAILHFNKVLLDNDSKSKDIEQIINYFTEWHQKTVDLTAKNIDMVLMDDYYYPTSIAKMSATLLMLKIGFDLTISDGVDSFNNMVIDMDHLQYK